MCSQSTVPDPVPSSCSSNTRASVILLGTNPDSHNWKVSGEDCALDFSTEVTPEADTDKDPGTSAPSPCLDSQDTEPQAGTSYASAHSSVPIPTVENKLPSVVSQRTVVPFCPNLLLSLLESSETGKSLLKRSKEGEFTIKSQKELTGIIAEYHLSLEIETTEAVLDEYASSIVLLFRQEKKVTNL